MGELAQGFFKFKPNKDSNEPEKKRRRRRLDDGEEYDAEKEDLLERLFKRYPF